MSIATIFGRDTRPAPPKPSPWDTLLSKRDDLQKHKRAAQARLKEVTDRLAGLGPSYQAAVLAEAKGETPSPSGKDLKEELSGLEIRVDGLTALLKELDTKLAPVESELKVLRQEREEARTSAAYSKLEAEAHEAVREANEAIRAAIAALGKVNDIRQRLCTKEFESRGGMSLSARLHDSITDCPPIGPGKAFAELQKEGWLPDADVIPGGALSLRLVAMHRR